VTTHSKAFAIGDVCVYINFPKAAEFTGYNGSLCTITGPDQSWKISDGGSGYKFVRGYRTSPARFDGEHAGYIYVPDYYLDHSPEPEALRKNELRNEVPWEAIKQTTGYEPHLNQNTSETFLFAVNRLRAREEDADE
jgi:hypothetical protein